jgi:DNA-binding transcriptional ArsR family regulator
MNWQLLARANTHPLRISILEVLEMDGGRILSPSDLSHELRMPLSNINYHVTELAKAKLIDLAFKRQVRGATEHFYRALDGSRSKANGNGRRKRTTGLEPATSSLGSSRSTS